MLLDGGAVPAGQVFSSVTLAIDELDRFERHHHDRGRLAAAEVYIDRLRPLRGHADLVLTGLRFLSPVPLRPGTVRFLRTTGSDDAKLSSTVRVVSTKVRPDGQFDVTAEFY